MRSERPKFRTPRPILKEDFLFSSRPPTQPSSHSSPHSLSTHNSSPQLQATSPLEARASTHLQPDLDSHPTPSRLQTAHNPSHTSQTASQRPTHLPTRCSSFHPPHRSYLQPHPLSHSSATRCWTRCPHLSSSDNLKPLHTPVRPHVALSEARAASHIVRIDVVRVRVLVLQGRLTCAQYIIIIL